MLNFIFVLIVAIIVTGINLPVIFSATEPGWQQMIASGVFLVFWLLFAMYKGLNREKLFNRFVLLFWGVGLILSFVGMLNGLRAVAITSLLIFTGPSYGIFYNMSGGTIGTQYVLLAILTPLVMALLGYFVGMIIGKVEIVQPEKK